MNENSQRIIAIGDSHGDWSGILRRNFTFSNSIFIHVGDFGVGFNWAKEKERLEKIAELLKSKGNKLYVIRGNHEDPSLFNNQEIGPIKFLKDNQVLKIRDKDVLFIGGAISIDRKYRLDDEAAGKGKSYWADEAANIDFNLDYRNVDIVVTHTAPLCAPPTNIDNPFVMMCCANDPPLYAQLFEERSKFNSLKEKLLEKFKVKLWCYGHFHRRATLEKDGILFECLDCSQTPKGDDKTWADFTQHFYN